MLSRYFLDLLWHFDRNHTHQTLVEWVVQDLLSPMISTLTACHRFSIVFRYFHNWSRKKSQDIAQSIPFIGLFTLLERWIWHIEFFSGIQMHWTRRTMSFWRWTYWLLDIIKFEIFYPTSSKPCRKIIWTIEWNFVSRRIQSLTVAVCLSLAEMIAGSVIFDLFEMN